MENYKNHYININRSQGITTSHKRGHNSFDNSSNMNKIFNYNNSNKYKQNRSYIKYNKNKKNLNKKINGSLEDYKRLVKKYYNIIVGLQDELTKQTIKNYNLLEENINLKQKINDIIQNQ